MVRKIEVGQVVRSDQGECRVIRVSESGVVDLRLLHSGRVLVRWVEEVEGWAKVTQSEQGVTRGT